MAELLVFLNNVVVFLQFGNLIPENQNKALLDRGVGVVMMKRLANERVKEDKQGQSTHCVDVLDARHVSS